MTDEPSEQLEKLYRNINLKMNDVLSKSLIFYQTKN